jgi:hypothetical protein
MAENLQSPAALLSVMAISSVSGRAANKVYDASPPIWVVNNTTRVGGHVIGRYWRGGNSGGLRSLRSVVSLLLWVSTFDFALQVTWWGDIQRLGDILLSSRKKCDESSEHTFLSWMVAISATWGRWRETKPRVARASLERLRYGQRVAEVATTFQNPEDSQ